VEWHWGYRPPYVGARPGAPGPVAERLGDRAG
jgi:hypothetical protein